jgi:leader peptidase (prepilin peptidase)/N-methyltransferase
MDILNYLQTHLLLFSLVISLLGICVGSFLNVVIYRLPKILFFSWRIESIALLNLTENPPKASFSLAKPRSFCPSCKKKIPFWHNIPIISFLVLKGRCCYCQQRIAWRYPLIELLTAVLTFLVANHFGYSPQTLAALVFTWILMALVFIDIDYQILPDNLTLSLIWLGLLANSLALFVPLTSAVLGAICGYVALWIIAKLFYYWRGYEGIGYGDFKLLAGLGAWLGVTQLMYIVLLASVCGVLVGGFLIVIKRHQRHMPLAFGPYLAFAGWLSLLWGDIMVRWYTQLF